MMLRPIDTSKARIYYSNGEVESFRNQVFAYTVWLSLPKAVKVAFRGKNDMRPVCPWDRVDRSSRRKQ